ncbi:MAG: hypothetical protein R3Y68_00085 [Rikenellaceae bacterium]
MFTTFPGGYTSLYSELLYGYTISSDSSSYEDLEGEVTLYIVDSTSDEVLGVKKFYSTSYAEINIAPIVRSYAYPCVVVEESGFVTDHTHGTVEVYVTDGEAQQSYSRRFTLSRSSEFDLGLLSTLSPSKRFLALGESELLTFRVNPAKEVTLVQNHYSVETEEAVATQSYSLEAQESGFVTFNIVGEELSESSVDIIELVLSQEGVEVETIRYIIVDSPVDPIRLAWISSRGSIEHYTFPVISQRGYDQEGVETLTISSAYELYDVRRALAEIVESPKVWVEVDAGGYLEVKVESESVELAMASEIGCVELKISYYDE